MPPQLTVPLPQKDLVHDTLCRYGYGSAEFYGQILNGYGNASIPLETFVSDSQYMDHDQDFTFGYTFPRDQMKASPALQILPNSAQRALACLCTIKSLSVLRQPSLARNSEAHVLRS